MLNPPLKWDPATLKRLLKSGCGAFVLSDLYLFVIPTVADLGFHEGSGATA